jgi:hypothetical protein
MQCKKRKRRGKAALAVAAALDMLIDGALIDGA